MIYSHSYEDPETGELVDVMLDEDDADIYRNARPREPRGNGTGRVRPGTGRRPRNPFDHLHGGGALRPAPRPRDPGQTSQTVVVRPRPRPYPTGPTGPQSGEALTRDDGEFFAIKKAVLAELIPAAGQVWASFLAPPAPPQAVGDDVIDRDNAAMHRQALAMHGQSQTRILALTNLAARAAKLFL